MIQINDVSKSFGHRLAVDHLTLHVPRGVTFGLLGHNGAGKSTAIGMMLGQVWPSDGNICICGQDISHHRDAALAKVGAIFEAPVFYDYLSGRRNLEILAGYSAETPPARIQEVAEWVGLSGRVDSKVQTYSHGMRARLALAQALLPGPELLILDEPTNGLDPEGIHEMRETIRRLNTDLGLTILLSSHLLSEVEHLCSRIAVLHQGRKVFDGPLSEARQPQGWVRLVTDDFVAATDWLSSQGLIHSHKEGSKIALPEGTQTGTVVKRLVQAGFTVHEIAHEEQTLEHFYLSLVRANRPPSSVQESHS